MSEGGRMSSRVILIGLLTLALIAPAAFSQQAGLQKIKLVKEGFFEKTFGAGVKAEQESRSKQAMR
jgi:hypothetical protein